jgi:hypothetical protein
MKATIANTDNKANLMLLVLQRVERTIIHTIHALQYKINKYKNVAWMKQYNSFKNMHKMYLESNLNPKP